VCGNNLRVVMESIGGYEMTKLVQVKRVLLVSVGLVAGFAAGSWTPLGELGSLANVTSLAMKSERLSAFVGTPDSKIASSHEVRTEFQPFVGRLRQFRSSALSLDTQTAMITILSEALAGEDRASLLEQGANTSDFGHNAIFADSPNAEITVVISAIEAENQQIALYLQSRSPENPEYHLTRSIYESNNQWLEALRFMVQKNNGALSNANIGTMTPLLEGLRQKVEESTYLGRQLVMQTMQELIALKTGSAEEEAFKDLLISFTESYDTSYEIEEMLASLVTDYPGLVSQSLSGHDMSREISNWDIQTLQLVNERMQLKAWRQDLAMSLSGGPVS
jgi:hypothetical protein